MRLTPVTLFKSDGGMRGSSPGGELRSRGATRHPGARRPAVAHGRHLNKVTALSQRRDLAVNTMARAVRRITQTRHSEAK